MRYTFDRFVVDTERFEISENGRAVHAEPQIVELVTYLVQNPDRLITRDELLQAVWKGRIVSDSAISGRIKMARKILGDDGRRQKYIRTVHKKGFSFTAGEIGVDAGDRLPIKRGQAGRRIKATDASPAEHRGKKIGVGVLRFTSPGCDAEQGFFAGGVTEDLITALSKISKLAVVAHPESLDTDGNAVDARQAGIDLGVSYVLYGSVRTDGSRLRISAHLVDTGNGQYLWSQRYECPNQALFELQDEVTREVVSALQVELTEGDQALLLSRGTDNIEAWQLTYQGQAAVLEHHQNTVRRGLMQLQNAVELDAGYALAWSALAVAHWKESLNEGWSDSREASLKLSLQASDRALELEPSNSGILAMRSLIFVSLRKFAEAHELAKQALHLANSEANTIALAGITLRACCEPQLSIAYTRKAMELCPVYPAWYPYGIGVCHWMMGEAGAALEYLEEARELDPGLSLIYFAIAIIHAEAGRKSEARAAVEAVVEIDPKFSGRAFTTGLPYSDPALQARRDAALKIAGMPE